MTQTQTQSPLDAFEICAREAEGHADLVEEMRGVYPGDPYGALGRDANKMRKLAKAIRALRPAYIASQEAAAPSEDPVACKRCQGNGEVVTDWDRHLSPHAGDKGDETVAECTDCGGTGITYQTERPCACQPATDVIAWQYRYRMWNTGEWSAWSVPTLDKSDSNDDWEWRPLFAAPAVAPVAVSVKESQARLWNASGELAAHGGFDNHCRTLDEAAAFLSSIIPATKGGELVGSDEIAGWEVRPYEGGEWKATQEPPTDEMRRWLEYRKMSAAPSLAPALTVSDSMVKALQFYADPANWIDTPPWDGDPECITPKAIPVTKEYGRPCDCGDLARKALAALSAGTATPKPEVEK